MTTKGYLAAVYKSAGVTVGGSTIHSLLTNGDFETGDLTGWTTVVGLAGTATVTALAGYKEQSYGCKIVDDGSGVEINQTITLDFALAADTRCVAYCWAKLSSGDAATLELDFLDATDTSLGSATKAISSNNPFYGDGEWGYWSVFGTAPVNTKKIKVRIYSAAAITWYVDNCGAALLEQILGAYQLKLKQSKDAIPVDTFKSLQDNSGARSFILGLESVEFSSDTIWQGSETYPEVQNGTEVFAQVFFEDGTVKDRAEFWAVMNSKEYNADPGDAVKKSITLTATGRGAKGSALIGLIKG